MIVSDTAHADSSKDRSGPKIREILESIGGYQVVEGFESIVPDNAKDIHDIVRRWVDSGNVDWIITTGGTGFGVRDNTPEVK